MIRPLADPVPGAAPISKATAAAAGRSVSSAGEGLAHAEVEPVRCYSSMAEVAEDFRQLFDRHGRELLALFGQPEPDSRRCAGRGGLETGAAVSEGLSAPNVAPGAF